VIDTMEKNELVKREQNPKDRRSTLVKLEKKGIDLKSQIPYIGCVSGAILKEEYTQKVKDTGFRQVKIEEETKFSLDFIINNQEILDFVEKNNIPSEKIKDIADNILSIKLSAIK
ncbi:MAG: hypothetical protein KGD57_05335, partial [Candidatus Lokiarchaeota archaeon]|nr:hypothetical protein [Candidatus Lokiarchaeota archaeon]